MEQHTRLGIMSSEPETSDMIIRIEQNQTNCYLLKVNDGFILIDTGFTKHRQEIAEQMEKAGCTQGKLKLIILTHGDFDHTGNCTYFRDKHDCKVAMHSSDVGMVERGDFFWNRENRSITKILGKLMISLLRMNLKKEDRFSPDILLEDMQDISDLGLDAKVIHIPGHSKGSIGILTNDGDFFCGDLFVNTSNPEKNKMISNVDEYESSIRKVRGFEIRTIFPGHGKPFMMNDVSNMNNHQDK